MEEKSCPITEMVIQEITSDLPAFRESLQKFSDSVSGGQREKIRTAIKSDLLTHQPGETAISPSAIDGACLDIPLGTMVTIASLAVEVFFDSSVEPKKVYQRETSASQDQQMAGMAHAVRIPGEIKLIAESKSKLLFADGSWWSRLMETNKVITEACNSGREVFQKAKTELADNGLLVKAIRNKNCVSISKQGISRSLSRRPEMKSILGGVEVTDLMILLQAMMPGEYTRPRNLKDATDGAFGIEKRGFSADAREEISDYYEGASCLKVVYYKPHGWSNPIRMEMHKDQLSNLPSILDTVYSQTNIVGYLQPMILIIADRTAKQVKGAATLYGDINRHDFPGLGFSVRS